MTDNGFYLTEEEGKLLTRLLGELSIHLIEEAFHVPQLRARDPNDAYYAFSEVLGTVEKELADAEKACEFNQLLYRKLRERYGYDPK